jgi:hypothetical protein
MLGGAGIAFVSAIVLAANGYSRDQVAAIYLDQSISNPYFLIVTVWGLGSSLLAGYICGIIAKQNIVKPVIWAIVLLTLLSVPFVFMLDNKALHIALGLLSIVAFASGAWAYAIRKERAANKLEEFRATA